MLTRALMLSFGLALLVSCQSQGGSTPKNRTTGRKASEKPVETAVALDPTWIIAYDPRAGANGVTMILVNETHPWLKTAAGQKRLRLARPNQSFKRISNRRMQELVTQLEAQGYFGSATAFAPEDSRYFDRKQVPSDRYRGMVYLQVGERRHKLVGWRGEAPQTQTRLSNCRLLVSMIYNASNEMSSGARWRVR